MAVAAVRLCLWTDQLHHDRRRRPQPYSGNLVNSAECLLHSDDPRPHGGRLGGRAALVYFTSARNLLSISVLTTRRASWQERQILDRDPYAFTKRSSRRRQESLLPILFYAFALSNFFLTIPRSWTGIELQRSPDLTALRAQPLATDLRFKLAAFMSLAGTLVICYSLEHSIYRYRATPTSPLAQATFYLTASPPEFLLALVLLGLKTGYAIAAAFDWSVSPLRVAVSQGWLYGLGYAPALLIIVLFNAVGFCELNEDKALIVQRGELDSALATDADLLGRKRWWESRWLRGGDRNRDRDRSSSREQLDRYVEMGILAPHGKADGEDKDGCAAAAVAAAAAAAAAPRVTTRTASDTSSLSESGFVTVTVASPGRWAD